MHAYRAYMIRWDGHIIYRVDIECDDDEAAKERAKLLMDGHDVELWDGSRNSRRRTARRRTRRSRRRQQPQAGGASARRLGTRVVG
jgi:hypothetical protein